MTFRTSLCTRELGLDRDQDQDQDQGTAYRCAQKIISKVYPIFEPDPNDQSLRDLQRRPLHSKPMSMNLANERELTLYQLEILLPWAFLPVDDLFDRSIKTEHLGI